MVGKARYELLEKNEGIEIRLYPAMVIARVTGYGDGGFNLLFNFIAGSNTAGEKVSMTAPVLSEKITMTAPVLSDKGSIAFVMPNGYTLESTPKPTNPQVKIEEIPPRKLAALRFSGRWSRSKFQKKEDELLSRLKNLGLKPVGQAFIMRYNGPFTPGFLRRNEVAVEIQVSGEL
ncbi:MAG: heme-binding protein [Candidatus Thermoplasmatota archaeon]|nr:heme-binding protein [Candidatus Thermoplasmatota archaeon]